MKLLLLFILIFMTAVIGSSSDRHRPISERSYKKSTVAGFSVYFDLTINDKNTYLKSIDLVNRLIHRSRSILPKHLFKNMVDKEFKIYIFQKNLLPVTFRNSAEYIRKNQFLWDKRVGRQMSTSMFLVDIEDLIKHDYYAFSIFIHELAHFYHLECSKHNDEKIKIAYRNAKRRGLYKNEYRMRTHNEYFAEASVAFFGDRKWYTRYPYTALDMKKHDPAGYKLCLDLWSVKSRTPASPPVLVSRKPVRIIYSGPNNFGRLINYAPQKVTITEAQAYDYYPRTKIKFSSKTKADDSPDALKRYFAAVQLVNQLESHRFLEENQKFNEKRGQALSILVKLNEKYPNWRGGLIVNEINKIK